MAFLKRRKVDSSTRKRNSLGWKEVAHSSVHESEQTPGDGEGQGSLACCSPLGCKESDPT